MTPYNTGLKALINHTVSVATNNTYEGVPLRPTLQLTLRSGTKIQKKVTQKFGSVSTHRQDIVHQDCLDQYPDVIWV